MGIGKNMNAIEYDDEIIIVDMGFLFPGSDYPGINYITPDITWLEENKHKIKGARFLRTDTLITLVRSSFYSSYSSASLWL